MKINLCLLMFTLPLLTLAQNNFTIKGGINAAEAPSKIYLSYRINGITTIDSAVVTNGAFTFRGVATDITPATLFDGYTATGPGNYSGKAKVHAVAIYLETGNITVAGNALPDVHVDGTPVNFANIGYQMFIKPVTDKVTALDAEYVNAKIGTLKARDYEQKKMVLDKEELELDKAYIGSHPNSYISLLLLSKVGGHYPKYDEVAPMFNSLAKTIKITPAGKKYAADLIKLKELAIGAAAPAIMLPDTNGKMISLSSFKGRYVLIDFWASWCGACRAENPNVVKVFNKYKEMNFTVLGVSLDGPQQKQAWINAIKNDSLA